MRDLSEEGFSVRVMMPLRAGEKTPFSFSLTASERVEGEGKILWVEENGRVAGVQFTQISAENRSLIRDWLKRPAEARERRDTASVPPPSAKTPEQLMQELRTMSARGEKPQPDVAGVPEKPPESFAQVIEAPPDPAPQPSLASALHLTEPTERAAGAKAQRDSHIAPFAEVPLARPPQPEEDSALHRSEPVGPVEPTVTKIPEAAAIAEPPLSPPPVASVASTLHFTLPIERPTEAKVEEVPETAVAPEPTPSPLPATSVASALHLTVPEAKPAELTTERAAESASIPELPRLILPRVDFGFEAPTTAAPAGQPTSAMGEYVRAAEPAETPEAKEEDEVEPPVGLPDISTILIQPSGKHDEHAPHGVRSSALPPIGHMPAKPDAGRQVPFTLTAAITIMCILTVLVGVYVYHREIGRGLIWLGEQMGGAKGKNTQAVTPDQNPSPSPASESHNEQTGNEEKGPEKTGPNDALPPVTPLSGITAPSSGADQEPGQAEYLQAMNLLQGNNASADVGAAVRLLWGAVEKGNPSAEIVLADMYWHGQGVVKNCDQTRILLTAAARKGSAEGKKRLQQFQQAGCE